MADSPATNVLDGKLDLALEERRQLEKLSQQFKQSSHDIVVLDPPGMFAMWLGARQKEGSSLPAAQEEMRAKLTDWDMEQYWDMLRDHAELGATYTATAQDVHLLNKLARDLGRGGSLLTKYRVSNYKGKDYLIFKGNHRTREILTGTRYLASNTTVVTMGVGKLGAAKSIVSGAKITLFLTITFRAIDLLLTDEATWSYFVGSVSSDVVKIGISGAASFAAAATTAKIAAVSAVAVGPLFAAIIVGVGTGLLLNIIDENNGFTRSLIAGLRESNAGLKKDLREVERQWKWYHRDPQSTVEFWMRVFGARY